MLYLRHSHITLVVKPIARDKIDCTITTHKRSRGSTNSISWIAPISAYQLDVKSVAGKPAHIMIVAVRTNTKVIATVITSHAVHLVVNMCHARNMPSHRFPILDCGLAYKQ